mmetsp:Transcript_48887/g.116203  ORF Transcript_48887/g.116203 Transcript_48887/m.116203 type:complete len:887 (-) Transcript_48887:111-2771(-)|eukprot:CAMPEP_0178401460 /NCGR_PEP_ID=MMETSP0689_2-20121128/16313_1 /TAXON_ID=160604 /ORGANISM="Amphidinium massartii, Strain CS-259" /LENGTH=886 /DNA_ID=CAMNT_0020022281 /DNA_START=55 /DNA_END=2715 /DNA_ORIENTATION=+
MASPPSDAGPPPEEEEEDLEDGEFAFLKADHPLMGRVQAAMLRQLQAQHERASLNLREKQEEYKKLVKHREEIGVTLYSAQQQLAKLQLQLEQLHDNFAVVQTARIEDDEKLKKVQEEHDSKVGDVEDAKKRLQKSQDEINQLNVTLQQVEEYNQQMKAEINVTRRATYKAEDHIKQVEKDKLKQDHLIDRMNEELKRLTEQKATLDAQLSAQKQESQAAIATLRDATREMESIEFEKKQLIQQWRSSLIGMQRRDEALQNVQQALTEQAEQELAVENEIRGLNASIRKEQERNEQLSALKDRNDKEHGNLTSTMSQIKQDREKLLDQFNMLKKSMELVSDEASKHKQAMKEHESQKNSMEKHLQDLSRKTTDVLGKMEEEASEQTTSERAAANSRKRMRKIREEIAQKEIDTQNLHNEIARVTVDALNTKAHNQMLKDRLKQLSEDLSQRERLIEQYEQEIRKRHHQIEKKQLYVDRLNRDYDEKRTKLEAEVGEADVAGPQEAKIRHMQKAISELTEECSEMQKDWIQKQTQLLQVSTEADRLQTHLTDQRNRKMVLEQKKIRIEAHLKAQNKEIKDLSIAMKQLRFDMDRMNGALVKNEEKVQELSSSNNMMEHEFVAKLKEIESRCLQLEQSIEMVKEEKNNMTAEVMEAERQVMLWERKISLEKEMQDALDPNVGQSEASAMEKEIHRMELRLDQLKRKQEQMIVEMERAVHKRDIIALKYEPKAKKNKQAASGQNIKRQIQSLKNNLKLCTQANADAEEKISEKEARLADLQHTLERSNEECNLVERRAEELRSDVQVKTAQKQRNLGAIIKMQRAAKRFEEFTMGTGPPAPPNVRAQYAEQAAAKNKVVDVVRVLHDAYPQLEALWAEFYAWLEVPAEG